MIDKDPPRLLDAAGDALGQDALRSALELASSTAPSAAQLEALATKISAASALGSATTTAGSGKLATLFGQGAWIKVSIALVVAGSAAWLGLRSDDQHAAQRLEPTGHSADEVAVSAAPQVQGARMNADRHEVIAAEARHRALQAARELLPRVAAPEPTTLDERPSSLTELQPSATASAARVLRAPRAMARAERSVVLRKRGVATREAADEIEPKRSEDSDDERVETARGPSELELLGRAQALLGKDPHGALEVIEAHAQAYPRGAYREEREALAIDALRRIGRMSAAQTRGRAFLERYPSSPHGDRIRGWLE